jgi:hypothetical protein
MLEASFIFDDNKAPGSSSKFMLLLLASKAKLVSELLGSG